MVCEDFDDYGVHGDHVLYVDGVVSLDHFVCFHGGKGRMCLFVGVGGDDVGVFGEQ